MLRARPPLARQLCRVLGLALAACGDDEAPSAASDPGAAEATPEPTPAPAETEAPPAADAPAGRCRAERARGDTAALRDLDRKPRLPRPTGEPPTELETRDVVCGKGRAAAAGDQVTVQYVGISFGTGEQFDASWDNGSPFPFALGAGAVIPGWDQGVPGMRVGGRRIITIPPELAYGAAGSPPAIGPNETLVFAVDVVDVAAGP